LPTSFIRAGNTADHKKKKMEGWIKLQNEELHDQCSSVNSITVIKLRRTRRLRKAVMMVALRNAHKTLTGKTQVLNDSTKHCLLGSLDRAK
jgi:hypothetical protein